MAREPLQLHPELLILFLTLSSAMANRLHGDKGLWPHALRFRAEASADAASAEEDDDGHGDDEEP